MRQPPVRQWSGAAAKQGLLGGRLEPNVGRIAGENDEHHLGVNRPDDFIDLGREKRKNAMLAALPLPLAHPRPPTADEREERTRLSPNTANQCGPFGRLSVHSQNSR